MSSNALVKFTGAPAGALQTVSEDDGDGWVLAVDVRPTQEAPPHSGYTFCLADLGGGCSTATAAAAYQKMAAVMAEEPQHANPLLGTGPRRGIWL